MYYVHILSPVCLSIDSMFGCCMCSGILHFVLPSLTCYQCDLQYQVSVSRGKLCMRCSQASAAQSLVCLRRCHGRIGWAGQPGGKKTCKLKWYAVSCYMICHDLLLLHTVPYLLKTIWNSGSPNIQFVGLKPSCQEIHQNDAQNLRWSNCHSMEAHLGLQGESVGCKGRQRKISVLDIFFVFRKPSLAKAWSKSMYG